MQQEPKKTRTILASLLLMSLASCASSSGSVREVLDETTGVTITSSATPLLLYRDNSSYAAYSRNYAQIGPIEVNQTGRYSYFLWVGVWNTIQDTEATTRRSSFDSITIFADGEPLALDATGWTPDAINASLRVYPKNVASAADA
jgi:hypothetical protein